MTEQINHRMAVLLGNGISIAYNSNLAVKNLTNEISSRFDSLNATSNSPHQRAVQTLASLAQIDDYSSPEENFEALLGPLEYLSEGLQGLDTISDIYKSENPNISSVLQEAADFCMHVRRLGVGHVLELIDNHGKATLDDQVVNTFLDHVVAATTGKILIGTLNYDHLADSALMRGNGREFSDMASGMSRHEKELVSGDVSSKCEARIMRSEIDYIMEDGWCWEEPKRVVLLHLHGSLAFLRDPEDGNCYRFKMDDLRRIGYWERYRSGESSFEPVVVLTNQKRKSDLIQSSPFQSAYSGFRAGLYRSTRWLIAGYSFQDGCVNENLSEVWASMTGSKRPNILVSTYGNELTVDTIVRAFGVENARQEASLRQRLFIDRIGVANLPNSKMWTDWLSC